MTIAEKSKTKVLVNVHKPLIELMKCKFDAACLKRDAYLDKALLIEAGLLKKEVTTPNSDTSKSYIVENLKKLRLKPLNLLLSTETVQLINEVCQEKNVPRDAFINRVFLLLISSDTILKALFDDKELKNGEDHHLDYVSDYCGPEKLFYNRFNVIDIIEGFVEASPFWGLRYVLDGRSLYNYAFRRGALDNLPDEHDCFKTDNSLGFNTFMTDDYVSKQKTLDIEIDELDKYLKKYLAFDKKEKQARAAELKSRGESQ
jgi:hypothetical protein